jgi:cyclopropane-fatty-acyl-phospholipid synthase
MNATIAILNKAPERVDLLLRKALLDKLTGLGNAQLTVSDPLGEVVLGSEAADGLCARSNVSDMSFYRQPAMGGSIGAAESYMNELWQADDLTKVIQILVRNRNLLNSLESGLAMLVNQLLKL